MADEANGQQVTAQRLQQLEKQARANGYLIYATMVVTVLITIAMVIWIAVLGMRLQQNMPPSSERIENNLIEVDERMASLFEEIIEQQKKMKEIETRIKALKAKHAFKELAIIQKIMLGQQKDYAIFLKIMDDGMSSLANMIRGSRSWTKQYSARMKKALAATKKQIKTLSDLKSKSPDR